MPQIKTLVVGTARLQPSPLKLPCYEIAPTRSGFYISLFGFIAESWKAALFHDFVRTRGVQERKFIRGIECVSLMEQIIGRCIEGVKNPTSMMNHYRPSEYRCWVALQRMQLDTDVKLSLLEQISFKHNRILNRIPIKLPLSQLERTIRPVCDAMIRGWEKLLLDCRYTIAQKYIRLTPEERTFLQIGKHEESPDLELLDCAGYALFKMREPHSVNWIRSCRPVANFYTGGALDCLTRWGYRVIDRPQPGCLVLYFNNDLPGLDIELMHASFYLQDGLVLSKMGVRSSVYQHRLDDIPALYGKLVLFLAKSS